jgi:dipeptidase E
MRLVLYSGGQERRNALIHDWLLALSPDAPGVRMTYVPVWAENAGPFYQRFMRRYRPFGATEFDCLPVDDRERHSTRELERRVLSSDIVYLAGGNTFYYLKHLRRSGLLPILRRFAARGGVLAGLSAGALILTPHIGLAGYPSFDRDENDVGLRNLRGLNLVRFEFFPHYRRSKRMRQALESYSRQSPLPVYACPDGSGLVIEDDRFTAHGDVFLFHRGQMLKIGH